jgi:hypothetical protein
LAIRPSVSAAEGIWSVLTVLTALRMDDGRMTKVWAGEC